MTIYVKKHALKHGLTEREIVYAWGTLIASQMRVGGGDPPQWVGLGDLPDGRLAQLVAVEDSKGNWYVFHALTPPTTRVLKELGIVP